MEVAIMTELWIRTVIILSYMAFSPFAPQICPKSNHETFSVCCLLPNRIQSCDRDSSVSQPEKPKSLAKESLMALVKQRVSASLNPQSLLIAQQPRRRSPLVFWLNAKTNNNGQPSLQKQPTISGIKWLQWYAKRLQAVRQQTFVNLSFSC
jgi:hypothetical protein